MLDVDCINHIGGKIDAVMARIDTLENKLDSFYEFKGEVKAKISMYSAIFGSISGGIVSALMGIAVHFIK